jgi:hypothetical protein
VFVCVCVCVRVCLRVEGELYLCARKLFLINLRVPRALPCNYVTF